MNVIQSTAHTDNTSQVSNEVSWWLAACNSCKVRQRSCLSQASFRITATDRRRWKHTKAV